MCGISGLLRFDKNNKLFNEFLNKDIKLVSQMNDILKHRGPDDAGITSCGNGRVVFGHRRLSIIDLSSYAHQPMSFNGGKYVITYNGEIYNFCEIKKTLSALGHIFVSNSDTEVLLHAYIEWGDKCLNRLNGMFSFAIWDDYKERLFLARDRYGIKPLYYSIVDDSFVFSSEYKAIILHPSFKKQINYSALKQYLTFQNIFDYSSLLKNVYMVPSGSYMEISFDGKILARQYWDYNFIEDRSLQNLQECEEELERLFTQAVKRQMISDVDIGAYLSGGIDSGSITAIASQNIDNMKSFTCGFDLHSASGMELCFDEREKAELMSYYYHTEHYEMILKSGDMERCMKDLVWFLEDPKVGQSYPNFYASKLASKFVKVVLSGCGGDELFAGYPWRYFRAINNYNVNDYLDKYFDFWQRLGTNEEIDEILSPIKSYTKEIDCREIFKEVFKNRDIRDVSPESSINHSLYFESKTFLESLFIVEDKLSMAYGLESRVPFMDNDLVDFAQKIPVKYKINNLSSVVKMNENDYGEKKNAYFQKNNDGKMILRSVMQRHIPSEITKAQKQGFSAPDASWFRGESIEYVKRIIKSKDSIIYNYLDYNAVNKICDRHFTGIENKRLFIWSMLNLEMWCNKYLCS